MSPKYNYLTLEQKIKVIHQHKKGVSAHKLSVQFTCGKTHIGNIIHDKDSIITKFYMMVLTQKPCVFNPTECHTRN